MFGVWSTSMANFFFCIGFPKVFQKKTYIWYQLLCKNSWNIPLLLFYKQVSQVLLRQFLSFFLFFLLSVMLPFLHFYDRLNSGFWGQQVKSAIDNEDSKCNCCDQLISKENKSYSKLIRTVHIQWNLYQIGLQRESKIALFYGSAM